MASVQNPLSSFAIAAAALVNASSGRDAYSYDNRDTGTILPDGSAQLVPVVDLSDPAGAYSFTDCNGWVNYALNSLAPVHQAVLAAARDAGKFNVPAPLDGFTYKNGEKVPEQVTVQEARKPMPRAFVMQDVFSQAPAIGDAAASSDGFRRISDFSGLQPGDLIAYTLGRYTDLSDASLPWPGDTGHVMIVTQSQALSIADMSQAARQTLDAMGATQVFAVTAVDSSSVVHDDDSRAFTTDDKGARSYDLTEADREAAAALGVKSTPEGGGLGSGTFQFATNAAGAPVAFRFSVRDGWQSPVRGDTLAISAARLDQTIDLDKVDTGGHPLEVTLMANRQSVLGGVDHAITETITGSNGLLVDGDGTLTLSAANSFSGGIALHGTGLVLNAGGAAGTGSITTAAGTANRIDIQMGAATVRGGGRDTITAAGGGSVITAGQSLLFAGQGASTVDGGSGSVTVSGGGGGTYKGGAAGHNRLSATGEGATLVAGGAGDLLVGHGADRLFAASGNTTLVGGANSTLVAADGTLSFEGTGTTTVFGGQGRDIVVGSQAAPAGSGAGHELVVVAGSGQTTVFGGNGAATIWAGRGDVTAVGGTGTELFVAGSGQNSLWIGEGAATVMSFAGKAGGHLDVHGFRAGKDTLSLQNYGAGSITRSIADNSLTLTLTDRTSITFVGVTDIGR
ncbi:hypothetical protein [Rhizosaccharibacter radicis]|uniref:Calcium-binding protein n=1 Tax=Rhizosaccharibacter radicis TaxID=2782605 RepID=A0ABT1VT00_9PROT|nr:calcium-binding protein [Acetobacteraceae bacterium KSS12]